jgi:hypothetical protein
MPNNTDPQPSLRRLHTIKDVCAGANISPATTWRLVGRDVLKTVKIGRRTFITDESYERLLAEGAPTPDQVG